MRLLLVVLALLCVGVLSESYPHPKPECGNDCMDGMAMPHCPLPGYCGFKPQDGEYWCTDCMDGMAMPNCPEPGRCGFEPIAGNASCYQCQNKYRMPYCPDPAPCGYTPVPEPMCHDCMDGHAMPHCPDPSACGFKPAAGKKSCYKCENYKSTPTCPDPGYCNYLPVPGQPQCTDCDETKSQPWCPKPAQCGLQPQCEGCMKGMAMPGCPDPDACPADAFDNMCVMRMTFGFSKEVCVLFDNWRVTNGAQYFGTVVFIAALCMLREWTAVHRQSRHVKKVVARRRSLSGRDDREAALLQVNANVNSRVTLMETFVDSLWYLLSLTVAYLLMLIFMTYNGGLCIALLLSCFFGHWMFHYYSRRSDLPPEDGDHCCAE